MKIEAMPPRKRGAQPRSATCWCGIRLRRDALDAWRHDVAPGDQQPRHFPSPKES